MKEIIIFNVKIPLWVYIPALYFLWVLFFLFLKKFCFDKIKKIVNKTAIKIDDVFVNAIDFPLLILIFVSGVFFIDKCFKFIADKNILRFIDIVLKVSVFFTIIIFLDRLIKGIIKLYSKKFPIFKDTSGVVFVVVRVIVIGLGVLLLLDNLGISITPILASLGIGSLAVALALQSTLENFFSGIQIIIDKPFSVGQFIKLDSGEEGYVEKIGWRSTWIRMLANNVVVIPNKILINSRVLNYHYPEKELSVKVNIGVHYSSDLEKVEKITIETAKKVLKEIQGGVVDFDPFIRYHTFNDSSIDFVVILRVKEFVDGYLIKHEFIKQISKKYREENIVIPYPIRTIERGKK